MHTGIRALLKIGLLANLFEWYEFSVYGFLAGTLDQLFFKSTHPTLALIQAFALFAASYFTRPLGSLFFGSLADRAGRRRSLQLSLMVMSVRTILIGMLPTYDQIGGLATVCLLMSRLVQGFGAGSESPVTGCYIFENAEPSRRGILYSTVIVSASVGILCGSLIATLLAWAWRLPFLLGIPITLYIFHIRSGILEASVAQKPFLKTRKPMRTVLTATKGQLFQAVALVAFSTVCFYILGVWMPAYLTYFLNYLQKIASLTNTLTLCALPLFCVASGYLADLIGYRRLMVVSVLAMLAAIYPLFLALQGRPYGLFPDAASVPHKRNCESTRQLKPSSLEWAVQLPFQSALLPYP